MTKAQLDAMAKCRKIYDLKASGITSWAEIAEEMTAGGIALNAPTCEKYYRQSLRKYGWTALEPAKNDSKSLIARDPQAAGKFAAQAAIAMSVDDDPKFHDLRESMRSVGLHPKMIAAFIKRLKTSLAPVVDQARRLTLKELTEEIERKISMVLSYMDDAAMAQASFKDLSIGLSVLIEKDQLLKDKPTHIIDFNSRQQLQVLMPQLMAEAKRRGITVDSTAVVVPDGPR